MSSFETNVFINCPFDEGFINDLLKPILFCLISNGLTPRMSLEISDSGEFRLKKITEIIKQCKYSIHDLSIVKSKKVGEYSRMNMPFELGIDFGLRNSEVKPLEEKKFLILEAVKYDYQKAISDISGMDIKVHGNETRKVFDCIYSWLSETVKISGQKPPLAYSYEFADFNAELFDETLLKYNDESIAKDYIENISIFEYIDEIRGFITRRAS